MFFVFFASSAILTTMMTMKISAFRGSHGGVGGSLSIPYPEIANGRKKRRALEAVPSFITATEEAVVVVVEAVVEAEARVSRIGQEAEAEAEAERSRRRIGAEVSRQSNGRDNRISESECKPGRRKSSKVGLGGREKIGVLID